MQPLTSHKNYPYVRHSLLMFTSGSDRSDSLLNALSKSGGAFWRDLSGCPVIPVDWGVSGQEVGRQHPLYRLEHLYSLTIILAQMCAGVADPLYLILTRPLFCHGYGCKGFVEPPSPHRSVSTNRCFAGPVHFDCHSQRLCARASGLL